MLSNNIIRLLDQRNITYTLHDLKSYEKFSAIEVSQLLEQPVEIVYKTIILSSPANRGKLIAALVPSDKKVDSKKLAKILGLKKISPLRQIDAEARTGMQTGGICPLGLINQPFLIVVDDSINSLDTVIISAGTRGWQLELQTSDLLNLCNAQTKPISTRII
jgi:Cys-tRNA(Pro)/Cys-tRNA(Cys) deacylase